MLTYDCALFEPLAFPPDLPPVILMDLVGEERWVWIDVVDVEVEDEDVDMRW